MYRFGINTRLIEKFNKLGLYSFNLSKRAFSKKGLKDLQSQEIKLNIYTINQKREMKKFIKLGVTGIITNYPNKLLEVMEDLENN